MPNVWKRTTMHGLSRRPRHLARRCLYVMVLSALTYPLAAAAQSRIDSVSNRATDSRVLWLRAMNRPMATRAELEALAGSLEQRASASGRRTDRWAVERAAHIRSRLRRGDFRPGDRIFVNLSSIEVDVPQREHLHVNPNFTDTVVVGAGDTISLHGVTDISLSGLLRSELQPVVQKTVERLYKHTTVRTEPLIRVAVMEGVTHPGYYDVSSDVVLSDLIMRAGGPAGTAALDKITVRRRGAELYAARDAAAALQQQLTLDQLDIQSGDVVVVPLKRPGRMHRGIQLAASAASIALAILYVSH